MKISEPGPECKCHPVNRIVLYFNPLVPKSVKSTRFQKWLFWPLYVSMILALIDRKTLSGNLGGLFKKIGLAELFFSGEKSEKTAKKSHLEPMG